jgi:hypothetical protein
MKPVLERCADVNRLDFHVANPLAFFVRYDVVR